MTTITNFIEGNFLDQLNNKTETDLEKSIENPVWILTTQPHANSLALKQKQIRDYSINRFIKANKPLIHIDFGISMIRKHNKSNSRIINLQNGISLLQPNQNKPYFIVQTLVKQRIEKDFLQKIINGVNNLSNSQEFRKQLNTCKVANKYLSSYALFIQGIESMLFLNQQTQVESFVSKLGNLHSSIKQTSILVQQSLMNKQLLFSLERISTCLTTLTAFNSIQSSWQCFSTVRRYTGYSNEQLYTITINKANALIVSKKVNKVITQQTKQQKQMIKDLGFVVKKDEQQKKRLQQIRKMIYPHLKVQQQCECHQNGCSSCENQQNQEQNLIVLDDEQQDEDDIDV